MAVKKGGKRIKQILFATATVMTVALVCAAAIVILSPKAGAETEGIYTYTVSNGEATITACDTNASGDITIPDTLGGYPVTVIGDKAFMNCDYVTKITISDSVIRIGSFAFSDCKSLTSITISDSVTNIENGAFDEYWETNDSVLSGIFVSENNPNYSSDEYGVLFDKEKTTIIKFPIGRSAKEYIIPNGVAKMSEGVFEDCKKIEKVVIPEGVSQISKQAFKNCKGLTSITIPNGVTVIGGYAFFDCSILENVTIPDSVTTIEYSAFAGCENLKTMFIPEKVSSIAISAFGSNAFGKICGITAFKVDEKNQYYSNDEFGVLFNKNKTELIEYPTKSTLEEYYIPDGVTYICQNAFQGCVGLKSVIIPDSMTKIGYSAFHDCKSLVNIVIPDSVTSIGEHAFSYCSGFTSITIPKSVTSIGKSAFYNCARLINLKIPDGVTRIEEESFYLCPWLENVDLGNGVTEIGKNAFSHCTDIKTVSLGNNLTKIGDQAFYCCSKISDVYYYGTKDEWEKVTVLDKNTDLLNADIHYLYSISYDYGSKAEKTDVFSGVKIEAPLIEERKGYTFSCWLDENGDTVQIPETMPEMNLTFIASWTPNYYDAVFNANGGKWANGLSEKTVSTVFDSAIEAPETPNKQGYIFSGWSLNGENIGTLPGIMDDVNGKKYTAIWIPATDTVYKVITYTMNTSGKYEESVQILSGTTDEEISAEMPEIPEGFSLNENASTLKGVIAADNSLILKIYIDRNIYTVTVINDEKSTEHKYFYGQAVSELETPVKDGYVFECWLDEKGESAQIGETMPDKNIVLTAKYKRLLAKDGVSVLYDEETFGKDIQLKADDDTDTLSPEVKAELRVKISEALYWSKIYTISFVDSSGHTVKFDEGQKVTVSIPIPENAKSDDKFVIYHISSIEAGEVPQKISGSQIRQENGYLIFDVTHFSYFVLCVDRTPVSIRVASTPNKTSYLYKIDKSLDLSGLAIEVTYDDGSTETVTDTALMNFSGFDSKKTGEQTVTVEYGGLSAGFTVNVKYAWWQWIIKILLLGFLWY